MFYHIKVYDSKKPRMGKILDFNVDGDRLNIDRVIWEITNYNVNKGARYQRYKIQIESSLSIEKEIITDMPVEDIARHFNIPPDFNEFMKQKRLKAALYSICDTTTEAIIDIEHFWKVEPKNSYQQIRLINSLKIALTEIINVLDEVEK